MIPARSWRAFWGLSRSSWRRSIFLAVSSSPSACSPCIRRRRNERPPMTANLTALLYLVSGVLFILALRGLSSPVTSRQGNMFGILGMTIAIATTLASHPPSSTGTWILVALGIAIGGGIGAVIARRVPMTSMPELVAAFHSLVGMAAVLVAAGALFTPHPVRRRPHCPTPH